MRLVRSFDECIASGVVRKITPDVNRAKSLCEESSRKFKSLSDRVTKLGVSNEKANDYIEYCYELLIQLLRVKLFLEGYMATGQGAHEAEVAYMIKMSMIDADVMMMNQLRYFRNGILYYGTALDAVYAKKIIKFTRKMYPLLSKFANVGWT